MTAPALAVTRWRVVVRVGDAWVPRSSARASEVEAGEVLARLQAKQPTAVFRVVAS